MAGELDGSDMEIDELEGGEPRLALHPASHPRPLPAGSELVIYQEATIVPADSPDTPTPQDHPSPLALPPPSRSPTTSPTASPDNMLVPINSSSPPGEWAIWLVECQWLRKMNWVGDGGQIVW